MRSLRLCLCALLLSCVAGCTGTMLTRSDDPMPQAESGSHDMFGGYPFQAVVVDYHIEESSGNAGDNHVVLVSLAIDLVVDTLLCPIDLIAWAFGCHKRGMAR